MESADVTWGRFRERDEFFLHDDCSFASFSRSIEVTFSDDSVTVTTALFCEDTSCSGTVLRDGDDSTSSRFLGDTSFRDGGCSVVVTLGRFRGSTFVSDSVVGNRFDGDVSFRVDTSSSSFSVGFRGDVSDSVDVT